MTTYAIRDLTREFGVTARTLRFYEDKGLINPERQGVTRIFSEKDRVRLNLTLRGKRLGFSLEEIKDIIDMYDPEQPGDTRQLLYLCRKIREYRKELINKINDIKDILNLMDDIERQVFGALGEQCRAGAGE
jgi:DNA-binding transcriptional MerR regulator